MAGDILRKRKIAVLGSRSVGAFPLLRHLLTASTHSNFISGKSSLVIQFVEDHFVESYYPTIESTFNKTIKFNDVEYECEIIDTAGQVSCNSSMAHIPP
jgi:Ras family protein